MSLTDLACLLLPQFEHLNEVHSSWPDKHLLASEACNCPGVIIDGWERGEAYGHDILGDLNNYVRSGLVGAVVPFALLIEPARFLPLQSEGWTDWNIVLNQEGGPNQYVVTRSLGFRLIVSPACVVVCRPRPSARASSLNNLCDAPIIANTVNQTLHFQPTYWYMGHFSRYLPPGSVRLLAKVSAG